MESVEERRARLLEKANSLPLCAGVYIMRDRAGRVIYVGKSRHLKNRVSQYFHNGEKNLKTARMVSRVEDFDHYLCDNEMEALSLENTLIKQYAPKYNVRLKDAKSYPYIKLTEGEYPRLSFTRRRDSDKARYFGPFSGASAAHSLIELLSRTLRLPTCSRTFPRDIGRGRPCINYQIGRCCGVCTGKISPTEYGESIRYAADLLSGRVREVQKRLEAQMYAYAEEERFEAAARCRDTLTALQKLGQKQKVVADPEVEQDVIALYSDDFSSCISVFYIRAGVLQDKSDFVFGADSIPDAEDVTAFLCEHYKHREYIPSQILLSFPAEEADLELLSAVLSAQAERKIYVRTPMRGAMKTLCELAEKNAREAARQYTEQAQREETTLARLASMLCLESYPERIEAYDISNLGQEHLSAGMIVCENGKFKKSDYRSFHIRSVEGTDDYASMREALMRRVEHLSDAEGAFSRMPDLILLDGGRGHVSTVRALFEEMGIEIPVFGMVKDDFHKTRALCTETEEISIAREQDVFSLIYRIQEEVHRYTVGRMESAKRKTVRTSSLTAVPGIGPAKAKKLLAAFGGLGALKKAGEREIAAVRGVSARDAAAVRAYFDREEEKRTKKGGHAK